MDSDIVQDTREARCNVGWGGVSQLGNVLGQVHTLLLG